MLAKKWLYPMTLTTAIGFAFPAFADGSGEKAKPDVMSSRPVITSTVNYSVPDVQLVRDDGKHVSLPAEMNDGRAVVMNFIFTTCSSFCPLSSQTFEEFQQELGSDRKRVHLMSISIDPEQDTPARLREYAHKFAAGPGWQHYTGTLAASLAAQNAFGAYRGDKMSHRPLTLMRAADGKTWRRIEGFATPTELMNEYRQLPAMQ